MLVCIFCCMVFPLSAMAQPANTPVYDEGLYRGIAIAWGRGTRNGGTFSCDSGLCIAFGGGLTTYSLTDQEFSVPHPHIGFIGFHHFFIVTFFTDGY